jgi:alpha-L-fucosidase
MTYQPTLKSLRQHTVPDWFHDAKLGIFVHWGLYSVPAWAPLAGAYDQIIAREGWAAWFARNPYAEWYLNSLRIEGSPTRQHHAQTYGADFPYDGFVPIFNQAIAAWDPNAWADLFQQVGARYVVLTTKHHDGFLLWPSRHPNPWKEGYVASRDLVGELAWAVRERGMRLGLYYSGGLDWTFDQMPIQDIADLLLTVPQGADYVAYADQHWRELIERYAPSLMWNDIGYPAAADLKALFADYYNLVPEGVINDRFTQFKGAGSQFLRSPLVRGLLSRLLGWAMTRGVSPPARGHFDFRTPEYASFEKITPYKWEATRGIGHSFGYNQNEGPEQYLAADELVRSFVDIVSKNGNLLLNVGPMADGTIPELQRACLLGLGRWLDINGEAIFHTRPWVVAEGRTTCGIDVRYTQKAPRPGESRALYAILLDRPAQAEVKIESLHVDEGARVSLLSHDGALAWRQEGEDLAIILPDELPDSPAYALRIEPVQGLPAGA